jgi:hypothetical protein
MVVVPALTPVARPELLIFATEVLDEDQFTLDVMFCVLLSVYVPVAVNCSAAPLERDGFMGVTLTDTSSGMVTVSVDASERPPNVPRMIDVPIPVPVATPVLPMIATDRFDEDHATLVVRSCVLSSE